MMTIEERKNAILEKIREIKASSGEERLKELDEAYKKGVDSLGHKRKEKASCMPRGGRTRSPCRKKPQT